MEIGAKLVKNVCTIHARIMQQINFPNNFSTLENHSKLNQFQMSRMAHVVARHIFPGDTFWGYIERVWQPSKAHFVAPFVLTINMEPAESQSALISALGLNDSCSSPVLFGTNLPPFLL